MSECTEKQKYVFISHSNLEPDRTITTELYNYLCKKKVCCWYDKNLGADDYDEQIGEKLINASVFLLVASENSLKLRPRRVLGEIRVADDDEINIPIVPFAIDDAIRHTKDINSGAVLRLNGNSKQTVYLADCSSKEEAFEKVYRLIGSLGVTEINNNPDDFEETNGVLLKYTGKDEYVEVPPFVEEIADYAFKGSAVENLFIPPSVRKMGNYAFLKCRNLERVSGMAGVTSCASTAFEETALKFGKNNGYGINGVVLGGEVDDEVLAVAEGSVTIADNAFELGSFKELILPEGLEYIGQSAFTGCMNITSVRIPSTVKSIGKNAFQSCLRLKEVIFEGKPPEGFNAEIVFKGIKNISIKTEG